MNQRIHNILEELETVRENLLALSDEIWDSIDHNDNESLERGFRVLGHSSLVPSLDAGFGVTA